MRTTKRVDRTKLRAPFSTLGFVIKQNDSRAQQLGERIIKDVLKIVPEAKIYIEKNTRTKTKKFPSLPVETLLNKVEVAIVVGGDGTILRCTRAMLEGRGWQNCSVLGVNAGKIGFLAALSGSNAAKRIAPLLRRPELFHLEQRSCLRVSVYRHEKLFESFHVLNDCVLSKGSLSRLFEFHLDINGEFISSYRADGMIISPPTGSTAYNLAAGGAILQPTIPAIQLTPICPQHFSNKPIVVSDENEIVLRLGKHSSDVYLTFDGQRGLQVKDEDRLVITRSEKSIRFLAPKSEVKSHFFHSLRQKLNWGLVEAPST
jgi:NAD+ kinase